MARISLKNLRHSYRPDPAAESDWALKRFDMTFPDGSANALLGPSGCGKTTLLNLIAGLDPEFEGEVRLPAAARIGYMFQEPRLLPWLTVEDNLRLVLPDTPAREGAIDAWLAQGAQMSDTVASLVRRAKRQAAAATSAG